MGIYRGFDQAALDREYSPSSRVGNIMPYIRRYEELSAAARSQLYVRRNLAYGRTSAETLDFFPARRVGAPLHLFIHGGYWQELGKDESSFAAPGFVEAGAAFAALDYALAPDASMDEIVRQARAAVAWLHRNARRLGFDGERIYVSGHSAGGHLVGMLLATDWPREFGVPAGVVAGATAISGIFDLEPIRLTYVNAPIGMDAAAARRNSPIHQPPRVPVPLILTYGENETDEFKRQTRAYRAVCARAGTPCRMVAMPGRNHFDAVLELADPDSALARAVFEQMGL
ncbi:MAG TPA: alpha/beta hydrolase [Alphaproteobacteria bacterium]|jgi:arylformamidase